MTINFYNIFLILIHTSDRIIELENENRELNNKLSEQENMYNSKIKDYQLVILCLNKQTLNIKQSTF